MTTRPHAIQTTNRLWWLHSLLLKSKQCMVMSCACFGPRHSLHSNLSRIILNVCSHDVVLGRESNLLNYSSMNEFTTCYATIAGLQEHLNNNLSEFITHNSAPISTRKGEVFSSPEKKEKKIYVKSMFN